MIRFHLLLAVVCAALVADHLPTASAQTVVVRDNFDTDEGGDNLLFGDSADVGGSWVDGLVTPGAHIAVSTGFGQESNGAGSTEGSRSNTITFAPLTTGTWYLSYDIHIGSHSGGDMQNIFRGGGTGNSSYVIGQGSGGTTGIYQEGMGAGAQGTVGGLFTNPPTNVFVQGAYNLDTNDLTITYRDLDDANNGSGSYSLTMDAGFQPEAFEIFRNAGGGGNEVGIDNLWIADFPNDTPEPPPATAFTWNVDGSGDWNANNWTNGMPGTNRHTAIFGDKIMSPQTVFTNSAVTVNRIEFNNANTYVVAGFGSVNVEANTVPTDSSIVVAQGAHQFQAIVNLNGTTSVDIASDATLTFNNALNLNGQTLSKTGDGTMTVNNVLSAGGGGSIIGDGGIIGGVGTVGGDLDNSGATVAPGNSSGVLAVDGNYTQGSGGTLAMEIEGLAGPGEGGHDQLAVAGTASLDGTLDVTPVGGYADPTVRGNSDSFTLLTSTGLSGTFATVNYDGAALDSGGHAGNGLFRKVDYTANDVVFTNLLAKAGDVEGDSDVDITDFNALASNYDPSGANAPHDWTEGDFDDNDTIDLTDFNGLASNFAPGGYGDGPGQVPEPSAILLLAIGLLATVCWRRYG